MNKWKKCKKLLDQMYYMHPEIYKSAIANSDCNLIVKLDQSKGFILKVCYQEDVHKFESLFRAVYNIKKALSDHIGNFGQIIQFLTNNKEIISILVAAIGVFFAGLQIYNSNVYNKNKNTFDLLFNWSKNTEIRIKIKSNDLYIKWVKSSNGDSCFWHHMLSTKYELTDREKYDFYPEHLINECNDNLENKNCFGELYEDLVDLFNYYETLSMAYFNDQYKSDVFEEQFKEYLMNEKKKFNWLDNYGWEKIYPNYNRLIRKWSDRE